VAAAERQQAHDRRVVEISYVLVTSIIAIAVLAAGYKVLDTHVDPAWQDRLSTLAAPGLGLLLVLLLLLRATLLLWNLERDLRHDHQSSHR
jgi:hypothetical protein